MSENLGHLSSADLLAIFESMSEGVVIQNSQGRIVAANTAATTALGLTLDQMMGRTSMDPRWRAIRQDYTSFPGEEHPAMVTLRTGKPCRDDIMGVQVPDQGVHWLRVSTEPITGLDGTGPAVVALFHDVTEELEAQRHWKTSDKLFSDLVYSMEDILYTLDGELRHSGVYGRWLEKYQVDPALFLGKTPEEIFGPEKGAVHMNAGRKALKGSFEVYQWSLETGGTTIYLQTSLTPLRNESGHVEGLLGIGRNISTLVENQERETKARECLFELQKFESLGVLAAGIAHDFNNHLAVLRGQTDLALLALQAGDTQLAFSRLQAVGEAMVRAKSLSTQLLAFAKGGNTVRQRVELNEFLESTLRFALSGSSIGFTFHRSPNSVFGMIDVGQMEQVIGNLVINAQQAMNGSGSLDVSLGEMTVPADNLWQLSEGNYAVVSITDTGPGVPMEMREKIFDPFFTTKKGGNGLGLASARASALKHGGNLILCPEQTAGGCFQVFLPTADESEAPTAEATFTSGIASTVAVLDDQKDIRDVLSSMLTIKGLKTLVFNTGENLLSAVASSAKEMRPRLAIIDLTLQEGLSGRKTALELKAIDDKITLIACSGYSDNDVALNPKAFGFDAFLAKPFTLTDLERILAQAIGQK